MGLLPSSEPPPEPRDPSDGAKAVPSITEDGNGICLARKLCSSLHNDQIIDNATTNWRLPYGHKSFLRSGRSI